MIDLRKKMVIDTSSLLYNISNWNFGGIVLEDTRKDYKFKNDKIEFHHTDNIKCYDVLFN